MNKVVLMGRITKDVEYKQAGSSGYTRFTVAVDRPKMKNEDKPQTDFINCIAWGKSAETIAKFFSKGNRILIEGSLRIGSYENKDGVKIPTADIFVDRFEFVDKKSTDTSASSMSNMGKEVSFDEEVPF